MTEEEEIRSQIEAEMRAQAAEEAKLRLQIEEEMRIEAKRQADECLRQEAEDLIKAADAGDLDSQVKVAENYKSGTRYFSYDLTKAFHYFQMAAEQGHVDAQNQLAKCYSNGQGIEKDLTKAFEWYKKSAEHGQLDSIAKLGGRCYLYGNGTKTDLLLAATWLQKAINMGMKNDWTKECSRKTIDLLKEETAPSQRMLGQLSNVPNMSVSLFAKGEAKIIPCFRVKKEAAEALEMMLQK